MRPGQQSGDLHWLKNAIVINRASNPDVPKTSRRGVHQRPVSHNAIVLVQSQGADSTSFGMFSNPHAQSSGRIKIWCGLAFHPNPRKLRLGGQNQMGALTWYSDTQAQGIRVGLANFLNLSMFYRWRDVLHDAAHGVPIHGASSFPSVFSCVSQPMIHARRAFCWHCQLRRDSRGDTTASDSDTNGDGMQVSRSTQSATEFAGSLLVLGRYEEGERSSDEAAIDEALGGALGAAAERLYFKGKARQTVALDTIGRLPVDRVILVGLGKAEDVTPASLRDFAAMGMDDAMSGRFGTVGVIAPNRNDDTARQIALGAQLATYRFNQLQAKPGCAASRS